MNDRDGARDQGTGDAARPASRRQRLFAVPLWCWWIPLVFAISVPWTGFTAKPNWPRVHWIPLTDPADKTRDVIANIALLIPFGYSFAARRAGRHRIAGALLAATAVSLCAEATQLFSTSRYPSATDVSSALAGAVIGAAWRARADNAPP
jgi:VanZ family protein